MRDPFNQAQEEIGVSLANGAGLATGRQLFQTKLAHGLQHREAGFAARPSTRCSRLLSTSEAMPWRRQCLNVLAWQRRPGQPPACSRRRRPPAGGRALVPPGRADRSSRRSCRASFAAVPADPGCRRSAGATVAQAAQQDRGRQDLDPRRGQLDGQRQPIQPGDRLAPRRGIVGGEGEVGPDRFRPIDEEPDRFRSPTVGDRLGSWLRQRRGGTGYSCSPDTRSRIRLVAKTVRLRAGISSSARTAPPPRPARSCPAPAGGASPQLRSQAIRKLLVARFPNIQDLGDCGGDQLRIGDRAKADKPDAIREPVNGSGHNLESKTGLADPAGTGQGEESRLRAIEHGGQRADLSFTPDERRRRGREISRIRGGEQLRQRRPPSREPNLARHLILWGILVARQPGS